MKEMLFTLLVRKQGLSKDTRPLLCYREGSQGPVDVTDVVQMSSSTVTDTQINSELNAMFGNIGELYIGKSVVVLKKDGSLHGYYYLSKDGVWKSSAVLN